MNISHVTNFTIFIWFLDSFTWKNYRDHRKMTCLKFQHDEISDLKTCTVKFLSYYYLPSEIYIPKKYVVVKPIHYLCHSESKIITLNSWNDNYGNAMTNIFFICFVN